jgi:hypothetical protein
MTKSWAYISIVICIVTIILAITTAALPKYIITTVTGEISLLSFKSEFGPFKECVTVSSFIFSGDSSCRNIGSDCRVFIPSLASGTPQYIYDGSCSNFNIARAFLILGIFATLSTLVLSILYMVKFSKGSSAKRYYIITLAAYSTTLFMFVVSFGTLVAFHGQAQDGFDEFKKRGGADTEEASYEYGACSYLSIVNFIFLLAATIVFGWFARPTVASTSYYQMAP